MTGRPLTRADVLRDAVDETLRDAPTIRPFLAAALGVDEARVTCRALRVRTVDGASMIAVEALVDGRDLTPVEQRVFLALMRGPLGQITVAPSGKSAGSS